MTHFLALFSQRIDQIQSRHRALVDRPWLVLPSGRVYVALILLLSMAAAFANFYVRSQQFNYWQSQPDIFFVEDTPLFSTKDAGYYLGIAQSLSRQDTPHEFEAQRSFPNGKNSAQNDTDNTPTKAPLLSSLIYWLAEIDQEQIAHLLHRDLFQSSFNQLFHLGRADNSLFEMIYDDYPHARIFRLQSQ